MLISLTQWGDKWVHGKGKEPIIFLDRESRKPISPIMVHARDGRRLRPREIIPTAGPGANAQARERLQELAELAEQMEKQ